MSQFTTPEGTQHNPILIQDIYEEIALGKYSNKSMNIKYGRVTDVDTTTTPEDVWEGGGTYTGHPTGNPETVTLISTSNNDVGNIAPVIPQGTGARAVRIYGLRTSTSEEYEYEDIELAGIYDAVSTKTWWKINRAKIIRAGSTGKNAGDITVRHTTTTSNVFSKIKAGYNQSHTGAYTVPCGHTMLIKGIRIALTRASAAAGSATVSLRTRPVGGIYTSIGIFELSTNREVNIKYTGGIKVTECTDIKFTVDQVANNDSIFDVYFEFMLVKD